MNEFQPLVSIVIPVYNGSNYMREAVDSALAQTYEHLEVIVVNDGSTDDTEQIALSYGERIRYFRKENGGVSSALNLGISKMKGAYFSWLSHDDIYSPTKVSDAINLLKRHGQLGNRCLAYTGSKFISATGEILFDGLKRFQPELLYSNNEVLQNMTRKGTPNGCCFLIPRDIFSEVGYFDETLRYSQDALMWYRLFLSDCTLISDDHCNVMSRIHKKQVTVTRRDLFEHDAEIIAKYLAKPLMDADPTGKLLYDYTKRLTRNCCKDAISYLARYMSETRTFSKTTLFRLQLWRFWGVIRYRCVRIAKKLLLR